MRKTLFVLLSILLFYSSPIRAVDFQPYQVPGQDIIVRPESERPFKRVVIGLEPNKTSYFMLPKTDEFDVKATNEQIEYLRRQVYWLNYELTHGQIFRHMPDYTHFFVAIPDPKYVHESPGNEQEEFIDYLKTRARWNDKKIKDRVSFCKIPMTLVYPQDMAEPVGTDSKGRLVLGIGMDYDRWYYEPLKVLLKYFSDDFQFVKLNGKNNEEINTEGGDINLTWLPEGKVGLLIGYHRVLRYIQHKTGMDMRGQKVDAALIEEARKAFQDAFFGVEVIIVGEDLLRKPLIVNDELFHLDMIVNLVKSGDKTLAFIPTYLVSPVDAITHVHLSDVVRDRIQKVYDICAAQLKKRGFKVIRLPFADHPVRNPVNVGKFINPEDGKPYVLLGKYPYHFALSDGSIPQFELQAGFDALTLIVDKWRQDPSGSNWQEVQKYFDEIWKMMDDIPQKKNPLFDRQAEIYKLHGISVIGVPIFPTGDGGLHCLLLK